MTEPDLLAAAEAPPDAVLWTVQQIAERDQISKQAVSSRARRLMAESGLYVETDSRGRITRLNVVQYDSLRQRFGDAAKAKAPKPKAAAPMPAADSRDEAMRRQAWIEAERARLSLDELTGKLVRVAAVADAVATCGDKIAEILDRLPNVADDLAAAVARDGSHGLRQALGGEAHRLRAEIANALRAVTGTAPAEQEVAPAEPVPT
jgi:hypothetical protein